DNTESIAAALARYVHFARSYDTVNRFYRVLASLTPADLQAAAKRYFTDERLVVTTLSKDALPAGIERAPPLASLAPGAAPAAREATTDGSDLAMLVQKSALPQLNVKLLFTVGSAADPPGKEGLAALAADMITEAGSRAKRIDEINRALYPIAGSFSARV